MMISTTTSTASAPARRIISCWLSLGPLRPPDPQDPPEAPPDARRGRGDREVRVGCSSSSKNDIADAKLRAKGLLTASMAVRWHVHDSLHRRDLLLYGRRRNRCSTQR